jgi:hypothetical protein
MARHTLYAYVDGSDLHAIAMELESRLERFVEGEAWCVQAPLIVNQRRPEDPTLPAGDLPDWDLGLNLDLPDLGNETLDWFSDVERIIRFLGKLRESLGRDFVIGIGDNDRGYSEDIFFVNTAAPDLRTLRRVIGVGADTA